MYSKILVSVDGSENSLRALRHGLFLASRLKTKLSVLYVLEIPPVVYVQSQKIINSAIESIEDEAKKVFSEVDKEAKKYDYAYEAVILKGHPVASVIIEYADQKDMEIIIIGSRGFGKFKTAILGSVSHHIIHHTKRPVILIK
jgi:nucleotide-binding universal stress UspA family protein